MTWYPETISCPWPSFVLCSQPMPPLCVMEQTTRLSLPSDLGTQHVVCQRNTCFVLWSTSSAKKIVSVWQPTEQETKRYIGHSYCPKVVIPQAFRVYLAAYNKCFLFRIKYFLAMWNVSLLALEICQSKL